MEFKQRFSIKRVFMLTMIILLLIAIGFLTLRFSWDDHDKNVPDKYTFQTCKYKGVMVKAFPKLRIVLSEYDCFG